MLDSCVSGIRETLPAIDALLSRHETTTLGDYVQRLSRSDPPGYQCNRDFIAEVATYTRETLGAEAGDRIADELEELPQVLTANHHGIDTFAQSTQSNLLFSMRKRADGNYFKSIPVLACGSVPLNNLTYPRGLLIYASAGGDGDGGIRRLPLFPDSQKRKLVCAAGPFTAEMLNRARSRAKKLIEDGGLMRSLEPALNRLFADFADIGHDFPDYSRQATMVNHRLWRRLFQAGSCHSDLVYMALEGIATRLLEKDLFDDSTICHQLMFDPALRKQLIDRLDGQRGCWHAEKLMRRTSDSSVENTSRSADSSAGTMFFWGVDARGRQVPLAIAGNQNGSGPHLRGMDNRGQICSIPFTADRIAQALRERRLLPSIFTSYLLLSIARGIRCIGGYYQADYLPVMRQAVVETLTGAGVGDCGSTPDLYLSGMQAVGLDCGNRLLPAGPVEIIAGGGIDAELYHRIGEVTVLDAHIASLYDIIMDVAPNDSGFGLANSDISRLVRDSVGDKITLITIS